MLCILKWKAAPRQLPISAEAKPEMREQGRSQQLGAAVCGAGGGGGHGAPPAQQAACRAGDPREGPAQLGALRGGWGGGLYGDGVASGAVSSRGVFAGNPQAQPAASRGSAQKFFFTLHTKGKWEEPCVKGGDLPWV